MKTNVFYSYETKMKAIEMKLSGVPMKVIKLELGIKNDSQIYQWYYWYRDGEIHRLKQPMENNIHLVMALMK